jgi:hypothetical protein
MPDGPQDCADAARRAPVEAWCPRRYAPQLPVEYVCYEECRSRRCGRRTLDVDTFRTCMAGCRRCEHRWRDWESLWYRFPLCPDCQTALPVEDHDDDY